MPFSYCGDSILSLPFCDADTHRDFVFFVMLQTSMSMNEETNVNKHNIL